MNYSKKILWHIILISLMNAMTYGHADEKLDCVMPDML